MATPSDPVLYKKIKDKVRSKVKRWPSAYASGQVVQQYKAAFEKTHGRRKQPYISSDGAHLTRWFKEKWVDLCNTVKGKPTPCGKSPSSKANMYPYCRPSVRVDKKTPMTVQELVKKFGKSKIAEQCATKQRYKKKSLANLKK